MNLTSLHDAKYESLLPLPFPFSDLFSLDLNAPLKEMWLIEQTEAETVNLSRVYWVFYFEILRT